MAKDKHHDHECSGYGRRDQLAVKVVNAQAAVARAVRITKAAVTGQGKR